MKPCFDIKKFIIIAMQIMLGISSMTSQNANIKILCINDMHAAIDNMPKLAFVVDSIRAKYPSAILMSAGDIRTGNPFNDMCNESNKPMIDLMNLIGFNMSTMGNHECDGGVKSFVRNINESYFPYLVANAYPADSLKMHIRPFHLFMQDSVRIGVIGLVQVGTNGTPNANPINMKGIRFTDPFDEADNYSWLRDRCDIYIGLTHLGMALDTVMAKKHPEFDLLVCGHSHDLVPGIIYNDVMIVQADRCVNYLNEVDITVQDGKVTERTCKTIDINAATGVNAQAKYMVDNYNNAKEFYQILAVAITPFEKKEELGCLMADAHRYITQADIAIVNCGGVRYNQKEAGDITVNDVLKLDPFGNELIIANLNGHQLAEVLLKIPNKDGYGPAFVSGLRYNIRKDKDDPKIYTVQLFDEYGEKLDMDKIYTVAINSYLGAVIPIFAEVGFTNTYITAADALMQYLEEMKIVDYNGVRRVNVD